MENPMKKKEQGYAVLGEVTPDTFDRFLQWIYQGFYTAPQPKTVEASSPTLPDTSTTEKTNEMETEGSVNEFASEATDVVDIGKPINEPMYGWGGFGSLSTKKKGKKVRKKTNMLPSDIYKADQTEDFPYIQHSVDCRKSLRQAFISRPYEAFRSAVPIPPARKNENKNEDYTDVFLGHARLYVFADKYLIYDLRTLALENLHETLKNFQLYFQRTSDIISLIHYVYENTKIPDEGETEPVRTMLVEYISFEMDNLMKDLAFRDLMTKDEILDTEQRRSLFDDYIAAVMRRI